MGGIIGGLIGTSGENSSSTNNSESTPQIIDTWVRDDTGCGDNYPKIVLGWDYEDPQGSSQKEYHIKIYQDDDQLFEERHEGTADRFFFDDHFNFNDDYQWEVRVKNNHNNWSQWVDGENFTTPYRYPNVDFEHTPEEPFTEELVTFSDQSEIYVGSISETFYSWEFSGNTNLEEDPKGDGEGYREIELEYNNNGEETVKLEVTDSQDRTCSTEKSLRVGEVVPDWQEVGVK